MTRGTGWPRIRGALPVALAAAATLVCGAIAIDRQSFWLDELGTWQIANRPDVLAWFRGFLAIGNSDGQLPLYHALVFLWSRVVGLGEVALRSLNLVLLLAATLSVANSRALPGTTRTRWIVLTIVDCFVVAYLDEARPYVLLLLGATWTALALAAADGARADARRADAAIVWLTLGTLASVGGSPITLPFAGAAMIACLTLAGRAGRPALLAALRSRLPLILACASVAAMVLALVLYSLAKHATPELRNATSLPTILFGLIEIAGGAGLVPGREALRAGGLHAIQGWQWAALLLLALALAGPLLRACTGPRRALAIALLGVAGVAVVAVAGAGVAMGFRVVGRHFAFACPPLLLAAAIGLDGPRRIPVAVRSALLIALLTVSTLLFRTSAEHGKDQTGTAAALADRTRRSGGVVWWAGSYIVPDHFGLPTVTLAGARGRTAAVVVRAAADEDWRRPPAPPPDPSLIVVERPEVADADGFFARAATRSGLSRAERLRGYVVYRGVPPR